MDNQRQVADFAGTSRYARMSCYDRGRVDLLTAGRRVFASSSRWSNVKQTMALLTARTLKAILDDSTSFLNPEQGAALARRLNNADANVALGAEWELLVLAALDNEGTLIHEPDLGGAARLDFCVTDTELGTTLVGDITTVADDTVERDGTGVLTSMLLERFFQREHLTGSLAVRVECEATTTGTRPRLPLLHEFRHYVFGNEWHDFVTRIRTTPQRTHDVRISNDRASLAIRFAPGRSGLTIAYAGAHDSRDLTKNVVSTALERKREQLNRSGHVRGDGLRCVVICDGACATLRMRPSWDLHPMNAIVERFLQGTTSVDVVVCLSVQDVTHDYVEPRGRFGFVVNVFARSSLEEVRAPLQILLERSMARLGVPLRTSRRAKQYLRRRWGPHFTTDSAKASFFGPADFHVSSRAIFDYLAGTIDRPAFERIVNPLTLELLQRGLAEGRMVTELSIERDADRDDDTVSTANEW
jgi:hypothetical protein